MKPIIKNFLGVIRRFKMAVILNILGLSFAFAAFMVIMIQLNYDMGFEKMHKDYDKIFRVEIIRNASTQAVISRPLAENFFESSPHIMAGAIISPWMNNISFYAENDGEQIFFKEDVAYVSHEYTDVFTFDFVEGSKDALKIPGNAVIPLSLSHKVFGNQLAVGKQLGDNLTVGAVYRDFPQNTLVNNHIYLLLSENENKQNWGNYNYHAYVRIDNPSNVSLLFENFKQSFDSKMTAGWDIFEDGAVSLDLNALSDIHFRTDISFDPTPKANKQTLFIFFTLALIVVITASFNFTNFSTALFPMRIKSINTQKVFGASRHSLRLSLISETVFICLISYFIAIFLVMLFNLSSLARLTDADLSVIANPLIVGGMALIAVTTGLLAGLYPAYRMTSVAPAIVLKGSFGQSPKGVMLRNVLLSVQFIFSFALMIGALFMHLQNSYMQNSPLGYNKDNVVTAYISQTQKNQDAFTDQLKLYSGIEDVTYAMQILSSRDRYNIWRRQYKGEEIEFHSLIVDHNYLKTMGIEVAEGRDFREGDANIQHGVYIFNEAARKKYQIELGAMIENGDEGEIIGFVPDIKFASFRTTVEPMAFYLCGTENSNRLPSYIAHIKLKANTDKRAAISYIRSTFEDFDANFTPDVRFYDEVLKNTYEKEISLSSLISLFGLVAIFISLVGVFGLVMFDSEYRKKEVGMRKILGSSTLQIIIMFNKTYIRILIICFLIAAPFAWNAVDGWLNNFVYKTPMYWWVYLLVFIVVGVITCATVTFQNWNVANDDPIKAIKND